MERPTPERTRRAQSERLKRSTSAERVVHEGRGLAISRRQGVRLLTARSAALIAGAKVVLRASLTTARWITGDDAGARHRDKNGMTRLAYV